LLYFNNLVFAGANVWPGQTITAINWQISCNNTVYSPNTQTPTLTNGTGLFVASNINGGSGPYTVIDITNSASNLSYYNLTLCNATVLRWRSYITGTVTTPQLLLGDNIFTFQITDSSYPVQLFRYATININTIAS
jgi:hypothetical protein